MFDRVLAGEALDEVIEALVLEDQTQRLAEGADCHLCINLNWGVINNAT